MSDVPVKSDPGKFWPFLGLLNLTFYSLHLHRASRIVAFSKDVRQFVGSNNMSKTVRLAKQNAGNI